VGSAGDLIDHTSNVTGVIHTTDSGLYCVTVTGVTDLKPAVVSLTGQGLATGLFTVLSASDCPAGTVEVETFDETLPSSTTAGTELDLESVDGGFVVIVP
jgi:hypothetical protein